MKNLKYITDAAMTSALVLVILLISHYTGTELEEMFPFLTAIPVAVYTMHYGLKKGLIPAISISTLAMLHNPLHALFFVVSSNVVGLIYGTSLFNKRSNALKITIAITGSFIVNLLSVWIFSKLLYGYTIYDELKNTIDSLFSELQIEDENMKIVMYAVSEGLIPSFILILSILEGIVFHMITTLIIVRVFKKEHYTTPSILKFHMPLCVTIPYMVLLLVAFITLLEYANFVGIIKYLWIVGINIITVGALFYIFIAILFFLKLSRMNNNKHIYIIACLLVIVLFPIYVIFGIVDSFYKFESKIKIKENNLPY